MTGSIVVSTYIQ